MPLVVVPVKLKLPRVIREVLRLSLVKERNLLVGSLTVARMTNDQSFCKPLEEFAGGFITMVYGKKTRILGEGHGVVYGLDSSGEAIKIEVNEVKFVPGLSTNLISDGKLAQKDYKVNFDNEGCKVVNTEDVVVATGSQYGGLYYLNIEGASLVASDGQHKIDCQHQWHRRLGHHDWVAAERLLKEGLATGMWVKISM